jgi:hypothetical protein
VFLKDSAHSLTAICAPAMRRNAYVVDCSTGAQRFAAFPVHWLIFSLTLNVLKGSVLRYIGGNFPKSFFPGFQGTPDLSQEGHHLIELEIPAPQLS